jgi:hypothetical protein
LMWLFQNVVGGRNITTAFTYLFPSLMQLTYNIKQKLQNIFKLNLNWYMYYNSVQLHPVAHRYYTFTFFFRFCAACQRSKHFIVFSTLVTF